MRILGYDISVKKSIKKIIPTIEKATYSKEVLKITYSNGVIKEYYGECTVWNKLPMMERCGTIKDSELCGIWKYIRKHGNPYPTAHLKDLK